MTKQQSYVNHNAEYEQDSAFDREKTAHEKDDRFLYQADIPHGDILDKFTFNTAVDIGCGTGWLANHLAEDRHYKKVYAIEPSQAAIDIAKQLYPERKEVNYIVGFADKELPKLKLKSPTFFSTMCVLAHLTDNEVLDILESLDKIAPEESMLSFSEPWGSSYHRDCWHVRTPEWWSDNLPDWEFEFYSDYELTDPTGRYKGFTAIKS